MAIISGALGNASEIEISRVEKEFENILVPEEIIARAYSLVRDLIIFTNKRVVLVDKQGVTGKKTEYLSIPYKNIHRFAKETAGHIDLDAELKIWLSVQSEPLVMQFKRGKGVHEAYQALSTYVLG
jgi:hypothetical protein